MTVRSDVLIKIKSALTPAAPYDGAANPIEFLIDQVLADGTSANQADKRGKKTGSISASSNSDIDLRAITDETGTALNCAEVCVFILTWDASNGGDATVKASASNGWAAFLSGSTDGKTLKPGESLISVCFADPAIAMSASSKSINIANGDSGAAGTYSISLIGRSA